MRHRKWYKNANQILAFCFFSCVHPCYIHLLFTWICPISSIILEKFTVNKESHLLAGTLTPNLNCVCALWKTLWWRSEYPRLSGIKPTPWDGGVQQNYQYKIHVLKEYPRVSAESQQFEAWGSCHCFYRSWSLYSCKVARGQTLRWDILVPRWKPDKTDLSITFIWWMKPRGIFPWDRYEKISLTLGTIQQTPPALTRIPWELRVTLRWSDALIPWPGALQSAWSVYFPCYYSSQFTCFPRENFLWVHSASTLLQDVQEDPASHTGHLRE